MSEKIQPNTPINNDVQEIPNYFHERWYASGYPQELIGVVVIPISLKIFAIGDM
jgi:response regulator RpfG family c-di-GMP phosphodiesterase